MTRRVWRAALAWLWASPTTALVLVLWLSAMTLMIVQNDWSVW